jgi:hypothetical protein
VNARLGRYELVRPLGRGGMAEVFLARHRGPGGYEKRLVIKRILPTLAADPRFLRLFFEEARLHVTLSHGNLVPIFDFGRVGNDYFLAMEYVEGADLGALLGGGWRMPPRCVAFLGQELCRALQHVHQKGLVHRDITPRNVLISIDGEVKLSDFGVAQQSDTAGSVRGTVAYMPPEQARGEAVGARGDLYALGLVLAEAATGARVRASADEAKVGLAAAAIAPRVEIDGPFAALIARATEPDPQARFPDAFAMAAALEAVERELGGSRAEASAALAERVRAIRVVPDADAPIALSSEGPATYFRDAATQASIVEEIVRPEPPRSRFGLVFTLLVLIGAGLLGRALWTAAPAPTTKADLAPVVDLAASRDLHHAVDLAAAPDLARGRPPAITHRIRTNATPPPGADATLRITCSPWCVIEVDGQRRGEDGRAHVLKLPPGRHTLTARRLEDVQRRTLTLNPGDTNLELKFE